MVRDGSADLHVIWLPYLHGLCLLLLLLLLLLLRILSSSASVLQLLRGRPSFLLPSTVAATICSDILSFCILSSRGCYYLVQFSLLVSSLRFCCHIYKVYHASAPIHSVLIGVGPILWASGALLHDLKMTAHLNAVSRFRMWASRYTSTLHQSSWQDVLNFAQELHLPFTLLHQTSTAEWRRFQALLTRPTAPTTQTPAKKFTQKIRVTKNEI